MISVQRDISGRLAFTTPGTETLQELPGSNFLVLSQRASGFGLIVNCYAEHFCAFGFYGQGF
jgi:hypothetical protein